MLENPEVWDTTKRVAPPCNWRAALRLHAIAGRRRVGAQTFYFLSKSSTVGSRAYFSADSGTAFSAALNPILEWVPSQKGLVVDAPHRQRAIRFSTGNSFPSASISSTGPVTM